MARWFTIIPVLLLASMAKADIVIAMPPPPTGPAAKSLALAHFAHQTAACDRSGQPKPSPQEADSYNASAILVGDGWNWRNGGGWYGGAPYWWWGWWPCVYWNAGCLPVNCSGNGVGYLNTSGVAVQYRSSSLSFGWGAAIR